MKETVNGHNFKSNEDKRVLLLEAAFTGDLHILKNLVEESHQDVNDTDSNCYTALHRAAMNGHLGCVKYLINRNCDVRKPDTAGCSALHHCAANGFIDVVKFLIESSESDRNQESVKGYTAMQMAQHNGQQAVVSYFQQYECRRTGDNWWL